MQINKKLCIGVIGLGAMVGAPVCQADVDALTKPRYDLKIGFNVAGVVQKVLVVEGDKVKEGQPLIELDDREGEVTVALYRLHSQSTIDIDSAQKKQDIAEEEKKQQEYLWGKKATDWFSVEKARIEADVAKLETAAAIQSQKESVLQCKKFEVMHDRYLLAPPHDGKIETILVQKGEEVDAGKPVLRLVATDPLWVDAPVPFEDTLKLKPGDTAWVRSKIPGVNQPIQGTIKWVAEVSDSASDTRLVRVEFANPQGRPAGEHMDVSFTPFKNLASSSTTPPGDSQ